MEVPQFQRPTLCWMTENSMGEKSLKHVCFLSKDLLYMSVISNICTHICILHGIDDDDTVEILKKKICQVRLRSVWWARIVTHYREYSNKNCERNGTHHRGGPQHFFFMWGGQWYPSKSGSRFFCLSLVERWFFWFPAVWRASHGARKPKLGNACPSR